MSRKRVVKAPEERRQEILEAARELFLSTGYEQTAVSDIVKRVGVAQGTFYWYFKSKEEVLEALVRDIAAEWIASLVAVVDRPNLDAISKLRAIEAEIVSWALRSPGLGRVIHLRSAAPIHDRVTADAASQILPLVTAVVRQGVKEGRFQVQNPEAAAFFVITLAFGFFDAATRQVYPHGPEGEALPDAGFPWPLPEPLSAMHAEMWTFILRGLGVAPTAMEPR